MTSKLTITDERLAELVAFKPLPGTDINSATRDEWMAMAAELQERRKADSEPVAEVVSIYGDPEAFGEREIRPLVGIQQMPYGTKLYRHAQPAPVVPVVPEGLNHETTDLVLRFASALADKLYKAEQKYGRSTDWMKDDWYDDCLQSLLEHIKKGDPKDVAAYCAFMWHHGWKTKVAQPAQEEQKSISDRQAIFALESAGAVTPIGRAYKMELNAYRASMLAAPSQEVK
ncbi:hypothetical protein [Klebsiella pneumoniae]|uniref:hypothetical protein n=1 Tax=Klebsiella pneumoniae TaxID=573 RepID=UPI003F197E8D